MAQSFFGTVNLINGTSAAVYVKLGFTPGRIELIDLNQVESPTNTNGWKSVWQTGMSAGTSINTVYTTTADHTVYASTNGITLLNSLGSEKGQYGAVVSGFTNASPGVITVDSTANAAITAGCIIRVANLADDQSGPTLNGVYYVTSVTATTITLATVPAGLYAYPVQSANTTSSGVYVSGGVVTVLQDAIATTPNPPYNIYSNVPSWYNQAIQGFVIGTSCFPNAGTTDLILISAWDAMQP